MSYININECWLFRAMRKPRSVGMGTQGTEDRRRKSEYRRTKTDRKLISESAHVKTTLGLARLAEVRKVE